MAKNKETVPEILEEEIREEEQPAVKGPLRDAPEPAYNPAWQVVNRRQDIYTDKYPPKIMSLEALIAAGVVNETNLAAYLEDNGYVKNTDYAATDTGGVIKVSGSLGSAVSSGILQGTTRTQSAYTDGSTALIISKGTLENIKANLIASALGLICDPEGTAAENTEYSDFKLVKHGGVYTITFTTTPPTP